MQWSEERVRGGYPRPSSALDGTGRRGLRFLKLGQLVAAGAGAVAMGDMGAGASAVVDIPGALSGVCRRTLVPEALRRGSSGSGAGASPISASAASDPTSDGSAEEGQAPRVTRIT